MVYATKFKLRKGVTYKQGKLYDNSVWNNSGMIEEVHSRFLPRATVESRNAQNNNERYIIDEKKTLELLEEREGNIVKNAEQKRRESLTQADLIDAIAGNVTRPNNDSSKELKEALAKIKELESEKSKSTIIPNGSGKILFVDMSEEELRAYSDKEGIKQHHKSSKDKLIEVINEFNKSK